MKFHKTWVYQKRPVCGTLPKFLDISNATAWVTTDLIKVLTIPSDIIVRICAVEWVDMKPYWRLVKTQISKSDQQAYYLQVSQRIC